MSGRFGGGRDVRPSGVRGRGMPRWETTCAVTRRAHVGARARSAPAFGAERVARGSDPAATGARVRSAHAIGAERVTRGDAGSHTDTLPHNCPTCPTRTSTCTTGRLLPSSATLRRRVTSPGPDPTKPTIGGSLRSSNHIYSIYICAQPSNRPLEHLL